MIDQLTIDKILDTANIVEVISDFVTLRKRGVNYIGLCPFHNEKTPSFSVSESKGICKCFSCGKGGNVIHFIMEHEQLSYYDAIRYLAKKYNIEIEEKELTEEEKHNRSVRESMFVLNGFAQKYFSRILTEDTEGRSIGLSYFRERGFRDDIIKKFQLGYSKNERDAFAQEAMKNGYQQEVLLKTGLVSRNDQGELFDRYRGRVIFPVQSLSGKIVAFGGRILKKSDKAAKYVNSPESEIYHKSSELYGIFLAKHAIVKQDVCYLVEGYTDVLSMHQSGIENVVASSGTSLTQGQIRLIHRFTNNICVLYDGDSAGIKASIRGIDLLLEEGLNVKVVLLPEGEDPDSFAQSHSASELLQYLQEHQTDFIRFKTQLLLREIGNDPIQRAALIGSVVRSIALIPDNIICSVYAKECSQLLAIDEQIIISEINKLKGKQIEKKFNRQNVTEQPVSSEPTIPDSNIPAPDKKEAPAPTRYEKQEKELIKALLKYGEIFFCFVDKGNGEKEAMNVCLYIDWQLKIDGLKFENATYQTILDEAMAHIADPDFKCSKYFLAHADPKISMLTADLLSNKYQLSKYHTRQKTLMADLKKEGQDNADNELTHHLNELMPRLIMELKGEIILNQRKAIVRQMQETTDSTEITRLMNELKNWDQLKHDVAQHLGERIVLKF